MTNTRLSWSAGITIALSAFPVRAQFTADNVTLYQNLTPATFSASSGNGCWGYVSPSGREYALMGLNNKMAVVEITNPASPVIVGSVSHSSSTWADIKVYNGHAYVSNENGGGIDVVDLTNVDSGTVTLVQRMTTGGLQTTHTVALNTDSGHLYLCGANLNGGAPVVYGLSNPAAPVEVGRWTQPTASYVHDAQIVSYTSGPYAGREILFGASGGLGLDVLDVTDKANIFLISRNPYGGVRYCHQAWTEDLRYLFIDDEQDEGSGVTPTTRTIVFDISDLADPFVVTTFTSGQTTIDHNLYVRDCIVYEANYQSGLRIFAAHDVFNPIQVGWFDTYPEGNAIGFDGAWSVFPFFPSGTVIVSDIERGLFILNVDDALAAGAGLEVLTFDYPNSRPALLDPHGGEGFRVQVSDRCTTAAVPNTGQLHYNRGDSFVSLPMTEASPNVYDAVFPTMLCGLEVAYYVSVEAASGSTLPNPTDAPAEVFTAFSGAFTPFSLDNLEADTGWTTGPNTATTGIWLRGDPNPTSAQPGNDHTASPGVNCWFTGQNAFAQPTVGDVDGGTTVLTTPPIGLPPGEVRITYYRWYYERDLGGDDGFLAEISDDDGQTWTEIESLTVGGGGWQEVGFIVSTLVPSAGPVRLRFTATDGPASDDLVEAAIDDLTVEQLVCTPQDADIDNNGGVELADYALLQACFTGDGGCLCIPALYDTAGQSECIASDLDLDGDVDVADYDLFEDGLTAQ